MEERGQKEDTMAPEDMTDEELQKVIETGVVPEEHEPSEEASEKEEPTKEVPEEKIEEVKDELEEEVKEKAEEVSEITEEEKPVSRRQQLRVDDLLKKYPNLQERAKEQPQAPKQQPSDLLKNLEADPELIKQLEEDRQAHSDKAYAEALQLLDAQQKQAEVKDWRRNLKYEEPNVQNTFKFLNPKDEENFRPAAANAMIRKYLHFVGHDAGDPTKGIPESVKYPDVSYGEFVEAEMEFVDELATQKVAETTKNIARQAAATGLRPDGSSAKRLNLNQTPEQMTDEELYAKIGMTPPKK